MFDTFRIFDASAGEGSGGPFWGIITRVLLKSHRFQKMLRNPIDFEWFWGWCPLQISTADIDCKFENRIAAQEIPTFSVFNRSFSSTLRVPSWGGSSEVGGRGRPPKSTQIWHHLGCRSDRFGSEVDRFWSRIRSQSNPDLFPCWAKLIGNLTDFGIQNLYDAALINVVFNAGFTAAPKNNTHLQTYSSSN